MQEPLTWDRIDRIADRLANLCRWDQNQMRTYLREAIIETEIIPMEEVGLRVSPVALMEALTIMAIWAATPAPDAEGYRTILGINRLYVPDDGRVRFQMADRVYVQRKTDDDGFSRFDLEIGRS